MRILVLGATGYVGSRVVPALLDAGHEVVAASSSSPDPDRFAWGHEVEWRRCDVTDALAVRAAVSGVDGVCYLVHSLNVRGFADRDRIGAEAVRDAVLDGDVRRVVYLSGLVPDAPVDELSAHISSRLEVEQVLEEAASERCSVLSLRAGVVVGAGSTSFEVIRQLATLLLVQPVPSWLENRVQPIAVSDVLRAMVEAFADDHLTGAVDIGGPNVLPYSRLLAECARAAGLLRVRIPTLPVPTPLVSLGTAAMVAAPFWTVNALIESLRHEMVCRPGETWVPKDGQPLLGVREAMARSFGAPGSGPEAPLPSDPDWTRMRAPILDELHAPATVRAGASLALRRVRALRSLLPG
ncbi:NAD-dependent epimerase/dehydratase family protein [Marmoricola sp. URHB0036]|uniref:NAD-dependent epimerase/dehydratase family protein n=1 Tax=Marmoricola sp. URHB0036 TaxID=1298863 RepID=UPI0006881CC8|nr:NAD-dependent epimerase/dehydratase family protein [Marmoricola sp. URHB0036]